MRSSKAFIDVGTCDSISAVSCSANTSERTFCVITSIIGLTVILVIGTLVKIKTGSTIVIGKFGILFVVVILCFIAAFVVILSKISIGAKNTSWQLITFEQVGAFSFYTCSSDLVTFVVSKVAAFVIVCA